MYCGTWVDNMIDPENSSHELQEAIKHRDKLMDYDKNMVQRLGIKDQ